MVRKTEGQQPLQADDIKITSLTEFRIDRLYDGNGNMHEFDEPVVVTMGDVIELFTEPETCPLTMSIFRAP